MRVRRLLIAGIAVGVITAVTVSFMTNKTVNEIRQAVQKNQFGPETAVDLSLKGIELLQGEQGEEQWRMKAKGAWYDQKEGVIQVSHPEITYFTKPDHQQIVVRSGRGVVNQQSRVARLWENVEIEREGGYIRCDLLVYNGTNHTLNMSGKVHFDGPDIFGSATNVTMLLNENLLQAEENVSIEMHIRHQLEDLVEGEQKNELQ